MSAVWFLPTNTEMSGHGAHDWVLTPTDTEGHVEVGQFGGPDGHEGPHWLGEVAVDALPSGTLDAVRDATEPTLIEADERLLTALGGVATAHRDREEA